MFSNFKCAVHTILASYYVDCFGPVGPQRTCPQVQGLAGSVTQGVWELGDIGRDWESRRAGIPERTRAHSFFRGRRSGTKWNMGFFCVEAPCASRARAGLEYVSIILCQTQKISPGPGVRLICSCLIFGSCFILCVARVGLRIGTGFLFVPDFQDNLSPTKRFRYNTTCLLRMTYIS